MRLRKILRRNTLINRLYYNLHIDHYLFERGWMGYGKMTERAIRKNLSEEERKDKHLVNSIKKDIVKCYKKFMCLPSEYFLFKFKTLSDEERASYVTDTYINSTLARIVGRKYHDEQLNDKYNFYRLMKPYFHRRAIHVTGFDDYSEYEKMVLENGDIIIKPNFASIGAGISAYHIESRQDAHDIFVEIMKKGRNWMIEEKIKQCDEMAKWNQSSVNTIRISAFLNTNGFFVLSSIFRTGRAGSVVDNAGRGGISAAIDPKSGIIISDGMDKSGNWYVHHPDSGYKYMGTMLPRWKELLSLAEQIHKTIPNQIYVGWDFALTEEGWVLIEGNWGELGAQQVALGYGLKPQFDKYLGI